MLGYMKMLEVNIMNIGDDLIFRTKPIDKLDEELEFQE